MSDEQGINKNWTTPEFLKEYSKRTICLRRSHQAAEGRVARQDVIDDYTDSENLADFGGLIAAYHAFDSLPEPRRSITLAGLNITAEQLFFISFCVHFCGTVRDEADRHATFKARCNVPLMNMPEFSAAFNCKPGDYMNPPHKCTFWQ